MTDYEAIPFGATVLVPDALRLIVQQRLLAKRNGTLGIAFLSLSAWLRQFSKMKTPSETELLFAAKEALLAKQDNFPIFGCLFDDPSFLRQCLRFAQELKRYQAPLNKLPQENDGQRELRQIITRLFSLPCAADRLREAKAAIEAREDFTSLYIYDTFFSYEEQQWVDLLCAKGAKCFSLPQATKQRAFYHAVNMRQEIEGIAQQIIQQKINADTVAICVLDPFYPALVEQLFDRYQIPYTCLHTTSPHPLTRQVQAWLQYYRQPDTEALEQLELCHALPCAAHALIRYLKQFSLTIQDDLRRISQLRRNSVLLEEKTWQKLKQLEEEALQQQAALLPLLQDYTACPLEEVFAWISRQMQALYPHPDAVAVQTMKQIQACLADALPWLNEKQDLAFVRELLADIEIGFVSEHIEGVIIHTLPELFYERDTRYLCGTTMNAYPGFALRGGIFDEAYCAGLPLPDMDARYHHHLRQVRKYEQAQQRLIATYPLGTYEGKPNEASLEIERIMMCKARPFVLTANHRPWRKPPRLSPETARRLYLHDQTLQGSISAFERYRRCPFSYFLRYGLRLYRRKETIDEANIGILSHYVLEQLCAQRGKQYVSAGKEEVRPLLAEAFAPLAALYPKQQAYYQALQERLLSQLLYLLDVLSSLEENSSLSPLKQEFAFTYNEQLDEATKLCMRGVIDRIDATKGTAVVLDYKSSRKQLSESKVFSGLQLQLLTYALIVWEQLEREVLGAFYISLKPETVLQEAAVVRRREKKVSWQDTQTALELIHQAQRLNGWVFSQDISHFDQEGTHIVGLTQSKEGAVRSRKTYDLKLLRKGMRHILLYLADQILQGEIACEPSEEACLYCEFHSVCRYHGQPYEKAAIIDREGEWIKEEKDDAEME